MFRQAHWLQRQTARAAASSRTKQETVLMHPKTLGGAEKRVGVINTEIIKRAQKQQQQQPNLESPFGPQIILP